MSCLLSYSVVKEPTSSEGAASFASPSFRVKRNVFVFTANSFRLLRTLLSFFEDQVRAWRLRRAASLLGLSSLSIAFRLISNFRMRSLLPVRLVRVALRLTASRCAFESYVVVYQRSSGLGLTNRQQRVFPIVRLALPTSGASCCVLPARVPDVAGTVRNQHHMAFISAALELLSSGLLISLTCISVIDVPRRDRPEPAGSCRYFRNCAVCFRHRAACFDRLSESCFPRRDRAQLLRRSVYFHDCVIAFTTSPPAENRLSVTVSRVGTVHNP